MHIVTGTLRRDTFIKSGVGKDGQSTMFGLELSEVIKDYKTGEKSYTNYKAILFAASQAHIDYYHQSLVKGNWVSLSAEKLKVEVSDCGQYIKLFMENARIDAVGYIEPQQGGFQQPPANQGRPQQQRQQQPPQQGGFNQQTGQQAPLPDDGFDDDISF